MSWFKKHAATARVIAVIALGGLGLSACATQDYVDKKVAALNGRVDSVESSARSAAAAAQQRADAANSAATAASSSAQSANSAAQAAATDARTANQRIDQLEGRVKTLETPPAKPTGKKPRG